MKYNEIYTSFAIDKLVAPRFDLLIGFHPEQKRHLTEEEESLFFDFIRFVRREEIIASDNSIGYMEVAKQFLAHFSEIENYRHQEEFYQNEWNKVLNEVDALQLAYIFHPEDFEVKNRIRLEIEKFKQSLSANIEKDNRVKGKITWTLPLLLSGYFGKKVEEKHGLTSDLKNKISLNKYPSGFIANYLTHSDQDFKDLLCSRQFEELVGLLFENEGWKVEITKKTRDGGKDAIITKFENGEKIVAYVEAKNPSKNKTNETKIREFFAVIRDETNHGYFVTSSEFTEDAKRWIEQKKAISPVILELIDNNGVRQKLNKIAGEAGYNYLKKL